MTTPEPPPPRALTLAELGALLGGFALAVVTTAATATGLVEAHALRTIGAASLAVVLAGGALALRRPVRLEVAPRDLLFALLLAGLAAALFVPGWDYLSGDRDPGVYVAHATAIAREGSIVIDDPVAAAAERLPVVSSDPDPARGPHGRFPGLWPAPDDPTAMKPQFYDSYAALLAVGHRAAGRDGLAAVGPLCGVLSVVALGLATRRAFGPTAGALAGVLLAVNAIEVWQARYPTAEMLSQALATVGLLGLVLATSLRWRPAAGVAGVCCGTIFLVRPDGVALVGAALVAGSVLYALRRFDGRCRWFAVGLGLTMPLALWEAYGLNYDYTVLNQAPSGETFALAAAAVVLAGGIARPIVDVLRPRVRQRVGADVGVWTRRVGVAVTVATAAFVGLLALRPWLTPDVTATTSRDTVVRTYEELTLVRLSWFLSWPGIVAVVLGVAVVFLGRWTAPRMALVLPASALVPFYLWDPHISSRLMWWSRRFVPLVLVGLVLLAAVALAAGTGWQGRARRATRALAAVAAVWMVGFGLHTSLPLTTHDELAGTWELGQELSDLSGGQQGVYLWTTPRGGVYEPARVLGGPMWLAFDEVSAVLPPEPTADDIQAYLDEFRGAPVFVITPGTPPPQAVLDAGATPTLGGRWEVVRWEESDTHRPDRAEPLGLELSVWRVR